MLLYRVSYYVYSYYLYNSTPWHRVSCSCYTFGRMSKCVSYPHDDV